MTQPHLKPAASVTPGSWVYDNRAPYWLYRWPEVIEVQQLAADHIGLRTTNGLQVHRATAPVLTRAITPQTRS